MSHFCGLVVLTPKYLENHNFEDSLEKYSENLEVPEYSKGEVSDYEKVEFMEYYLQGDNVELISLREKLYSKLLEEGRIEPYSEEKDGERNRFMFRIVYDNKERYVELFKETYPEYFSKFDEMYEGHGDDWNGGDWRINPISGKWEEYSTYNPNSKWDWYDECGRWSGAIKTKSGEYVNECLLGEIDWTDFKPEDYEEEEKEDIWGEKYKPFKKGVKWHFTENNLPFNIVVDGEWCEKGEMHMFGVTTNEMSKEEWKKTFFEIINRLPENSEVYNIDFHL